MRNLHGPGEQLAVGEGERELPVGVQDRGGGGLAVGGGAVALHSGLHVAREAAGDDLRGEKNHTLL